MSTSIRVFAERLQDGKWLPMLQTDHQRIGGKLKKQENTIPLEVVSLGQEYELFAVLAGVRQERFHQRYGASIKPISSPRGLPKDLSPLLRAHFSVLGTYISPSWFLVQELVDFKWTKHTVTIHACVKQQLAHLFSGYSPFPYEAWTEEIKPYQLGLYNEPGTVEVSWVETYKEFICRELPDMYDYFLGTLVALGSPREVRIVFGFC
jgi:hypothetical protein